MSEEKNLKIKDTLRATKERRSKMDCRVFSVKIQENRLSRAKEEKRCSKQVKPCFKTELHRMFPRRVAKLVET